MTHFSVEVLASCVGDRLHGGYKVTQNEAIRSSFRSFTSIIRQVAMNFEKETKTLSESSFFFAVQGKVPRLLIKKKLKEWLSYRKGTSKDGSARANATKAELAQRYQKSLIFNHPFSIFLTLKSYASSTR